MMNASCVVLNNTYEPLNIIPSVDAMVECLSGNATALQEYDFVMRSQHLSVKLPSVIAMNHYVQSKRVMSKKAQLTNRNLFRRDNHQCQYCGSYSHEIKDYMTRDHIHPKALGGLDKWENVTTACQSCNNKKADYTLEQLSEMGPEFEMELLTDPWSPTQFELFARSKLFKKFKLDEFYKEALV